MPANGLSCFTTASYSVTTSGHCSAVRSAIPSGIAIFHVPNVCPGRYSGSELTGNDHAGILADYSERVEKHVITSARARSSYAKEWNHEHAVSLRDAQLATWFTRDFCHGPDSDSDPGTYPKLLKQRIQNG